MAILCKLLSIKTVFFGASDVGFIPGKEQIAGSRKNTIIFRKSIRYIDYFVTQNEIQHDSLFSIIAGKALSYPTFGCRQVAANRVKKDTTCCGLQICGL